MILNAIACIVACSLNPAISNGQSGSSDQNSSPVLLTLRSKVFSNTRNIRVWLPAGYDQPLNSARRYPVFYFTDGVAVFHGRQLDRIAAELIASKQIPPMIFVGMDNGGSTKESKQPGQDRANEYLPFPDEFLQPPLPHPQGRRFPEFFKKEVQALVDAHFRTSGEIGIAGSSYGAAIALYTVLKDPAKFKWLLMESPSLYIDHDALLKLSEQQAKWPDRVYVGAGTDEGEGDAKQEMVNDVNRFARSLTGKTVTCKVIIPGAQHNEDAWLARLPTALKFLLGGEACPILPAP